MVSADITHLQGQFILDEGFFSARQKTNLPGCPGYCRICQIGAAMKQ